MAYKILDSVNSPEDLKKLDARQIPELCSEIRGFLIDNVINTGGHLASNLGICEITVALHRVFDAPNDRIIFDVGHQSYVHKILTGRRERFDTLRKCGGLSGFTCRSESDYDPFGAGHSSTSISAALGFAEAEKLKGSDAYTVAVIGDGAYTGGMVHEALNNIKRDLKLIIVLNENEMSISKNTGAFADYIARIRSSKGYVRAKKHAHSILSHIPFFGRYIENALASVKQRIKRIVYPSNYFEDLGLKYFGPADGNNYEVTERLLSEAKRSGQSAIVHLKTKKGKGYAPAESRPSEFHNVSSGSGKTTFHDVFSEELARLAEKHKDIVAVTAAMGDGTGLVKFGEKFPERYFDVGIAEEHALTFSAGLAADGLRPYCAIYSTFLQRGYDNILHDICIQKLGVNIFIDRAGLAASDGATHHGIFDVAFLSHIPGMSIFAPATFSSMRAAVNMVYFSHGPVAVRYSNAPESERVVSEFFPDGEEYLGICHKNYSEAPANVIITYGTIADKALSAADKLKADGYACGVILAERLKPYADLARGVIPMLDGAKNVLFLEEGILNGGAGMMLEHELYGMGELDGRKYRILAVNDNFAVADTPCDIYSAAAIGEDDICRAVKEMAYSWI